jgi:dienelactone hydrolase
MTRIGWILTALLCLPAAVEGAIKTEKITYKSGDTEHVGYLAYDDAVTGKRPGILVVHEWWGLNDYARKRAEQLARLGYVAFAADMYGGGKTVEHPKDAGQMAGAVRANVAEWRAKATAALNVLKAQPQCNADKLAAIGYCFGGSTAIQLALAGTDLDVVASFHGGLPMATDADAKQVKARLLICNGADDTFIPAAAIQAFRGALDKAGVKYDFENYAGAKHSFTVEGIDQKGVDGLKYNKAADEASWKKLQEVLTAAFR